MTLAPVDNDEPQKITLAELRSAVTLTERLKSNAASFVSEKENKRGCHTISSDNISFDNDKVVWTFKYNTSCHCHPEWQTDKKEFPLEDFFHWMELKNSNEFWI